MSSSSLKRYSSYVLFMNSIRGQKQSSFCPAPANQTKLLLFFFFLADCDCLVLRCRVAGRSQGAGLSGSEGSASAALLHRDDVSVGPSEDEESALLPGNSQSRRTTNGSLDSIFERLEAQPVSQRFSSCNFEMQQLLLEKEATGSIPGTGERGYVWGGRGAFSALGCVSVHSALADCLSALGLLLGDEAVFAMPVSVDLSRQAATEQVLLSLHICSVRLNQEGCLWLLCKISKTW